MTPFFSICIPAFKCGDILYEALASIAYQTFQDWEVIVLNDGSGEETSKICQEQTVIDPQRYTFIDAPHGGQLVSRMRMLPVARGKYILSLDSDDYFVGDDALQKMHDAIADSSCDVLLFNATRDLGAMKPFADYSGLTLQDTVPGKARGVDEASVFRTFADSFSLNNVCFKAFARECLRVDAHEIPAVHLNEDRLESLWIIESAKSYALLDEPLYYYRPNPASVTENAFKAEYFDDTLRVEAEIDKFRVEKGLMGPGRESLYCNLLVGSLYNVARVTRDEEERLADYAHIYDSVMSCANFPERVGAARPDKVIAKDLLLRRRFATLDAFLRACEGFKKFVRDSRMKGVMR